MAYEKTTWVSGDVITAENMNKIEDELATLDKNGDSVVSFELGDRIAKGVDNDGNVVAGAVIEGLLEDTEIEGQVVPKNAASGIYSHAEGAGAKASGNQSHAEGSGTKATKDQSHAEGGGTTASGSNSHAEGAGTTASGDQSHAEGGGTTAAGYCSHAEGSGTKASGSNQHVQGKYNIEDTSNTYAHIVGGGTSDKDRKNIHTIDWNGNTWYAGSLTLGGTTLTEEQLKKLIALLN